MGLKSGIAGGICLFALGIAAPAGQAAPPGQPPDPVSQQAVLFGNSPPLREMKRAKPSASAPGQVREIPRHPSPRAKPKTPGPARDTAVQAFAPGLNMPAATSSFEGLSNADNQAQLGFQVLPPDPNGDVGPAHYVQIVNLVMKVFDKNTGATLLGPIPFSTLFAGFGGACEAFDDGDPIVLYDHLADRWLISQFAVSGGAPFHQCIAVSQSGDPTGAYFLYDFSVGNKFNDYPKFGVWPDGYYMTDNQFNAAGTAFQGVGVFAFDRAKMLAGDPTASFIYFDLQSFDSNLFGMLPADLDGPPPPAGTPNYFAAYAATEFGDPQDGLRIFEFHADFANPANSTFTERAESPIATAAFDPVLSCGFSGRDCIPQPAPATTSAKLDAIADVLMYRLQYRNFGAHESLVANHTVDADGTSHAGVRYYELRRALPGGAFLVNEQATFAPDGHHRWMGSAAMDKQGNLAVGYSVASATLFPSIRYAGRLAADPPNGLFQGETTLIDGGGSQTSTTSRWGDYSMLAVDPADDCTFWFVAPYYASSSSSGWTTRIGSFKFPSCGAASADLAVTLTDSPDPVTAGANLTYTISVANNGPDGATGVTLTDDLPAEVTLVSASSSQGSCSGTATVTCSLGSLASAASATVTIVVTANAAGTITNTASASANEADPDAPNNTASASTTVAASLSDLIVSVLGAPAASGPGLTIAVSATTKNQGSGAADASTTKLFLSSNAILDGSDTLLGSQPVAGLAAGVSASATTAVTIPAGTVPGNYSLIAQADGDSVVAESVETNNTRVKAIRIGPDLTIRSLSAPASAAAGSTIAITDATRNQGGASAGASTTKFYLSSNTAIDPGDAVLGSRSVPVLAAGASSFGTTSVTIPAGTAAGTYSIIARCDDANVVIEAGEGNNRRIVSIQVTP